MAIGKVKWFNNEKKYGFILIENREVFVHFSAILKEGYKTLKKGQVVQFDIERSPRGERAVHVQDLAALHLIAMNKSSSVSGSDSLKNQSPINSPLI